MLTRTNDELACAISPAHLHLMAVKTLGARSFPGRFQMHPVNVGAVGFRGKVAGLPISRSCIHHVTKNEGQTKVKHRLMFASPPVFKHQRGAHGFHLICKIIAATTHK